MIKCVYDQEIEDLIQSVVDEIEPVEDQITILDYLYYESRYPGILYCCGMLYRTHELEDDVNDGVSNINIDMKYFIKAALEGYADAIIELICYYQEKGKDELYKAKYWTNKLYELSKSDEALYYRAINNLLEILYNHSSFAIEASYYQRLYNEANDIMTKLSKQGHIDARNYMKIIDSIEVQKSDHNQDYDQYEEYEKELNKLHKKLLIYQYDDKD